MKIFIGWSGSQSEAVAKALHGWLPKVIQAITPWISTEDIAKGTPWRDKVSGELEVCDFGIICVTPENVTSSWLLFEAGALSKNRGDSNVCTYLHNLEQSGLPASSPFTLFQGTLSTKAETHKLIRTINGRLIPPLESVGLDEAYELWWPRLELQLQSISNQLREPAAKKRPPEEVLEEVLTLVRDLARRPILESIPLSALYYPDPSSPTTTLGDAMNLIGLGEVGLGGQSLLRPEQRDRSVAAALKLLANIGKRRTSAQVLRSMNSDPEGGETLKEEPLKEDPGGS